MHFCGQRKHRVSAREHGTRISLAMDADHTWQLEFIDLGSAAALRARIPAERILNFMPTVELHSWTQRVRYRNAFNK
jgi:histidinol phosphatase-like PHP family hydrolase